MKRVAVWNYYETINRAMMKEDNAPIGDDLLAPFVDLARIGLEHGVEFVPLSDVVPAEAPKLAGILFVDAPQPAVAANVLAAAPEVPRYLLAFEPPAIRPENYAAPSYYRRIFTWHVGWKVRTPNAVAINYAVRLPREIPDFAAVDRLVCMIAGNKYAAGATGYALRFGDAAWLSENAEADFDLYGPGWPATAKAYQGTLPPGGKYAVLRRHTFSLCYENTLGLNGYVTEKILDSMIAGCIPVYAGAPDVDRFVPRECYVDRRLFDSPQEMHRCLKSMGSATRVRKLEAIRDFIGTSESRHFSTTMFAETILREIV